MKQACAVAVSSAAFVEGAKVGRAAAVTPEALARRRESGKRQNELLQAWNPPNQPAWLTSEYYVPDSAAPHAMDTSPYRGGAEVVISRVRRRNPEREDRSASQALVEARGVGAGAVPGV
jgi:hypothetical protein